MNVHHKCQKKVANLCGVNQKLMAEALAMIESKQQVRQTNTFKMFQCVHFEEFFSPINSHLSKPAQKLLRHLKYFLLIFTEVWYVLVHALKV